MSSDTFSLLSYVVCDLGVGASFASIGLKDKGDISSWGNAPLLWKLLLSQLCDSYACVNGHPRERYRYLCFNAVLEMMWT